MGVVKSGKGWLVKVNIQGVTIQKYFKDKALAEVVYQELKKKQELAKIAQKLKSVDNGLSKLLGAEFEKGQLIKLKVFWSQYLKWLLTQKKGSTIKERLSKWKKLKSFFGERTLIEITPELIAKFQMEMKEKGYSSASINRYIAFLRHMLSMAVKWGYLKEHPLKGKIEMMREIPTIEWTFLTREEFDRLKEAISERYRELFYFLVHTGARLGEALRLRWKDIIWEAKVAYLSDSKANRPRILILSDEVIKILRERFKRENPKSEDERVFIHSDSEFRRAFKKALKACEIKRNVRTHDLRHTFASWLAISGVPIQQIRELLGHTEIRTTMRYAHLNPQVLRDTLNKVFKTEDLKEKARQEKSEKVISIEDYIKKKRANSA